MWQHVNMYPRLFVLKIGITFLATMNDPWTIRNNRRDVFITGVSKKGVPFDEKEKDKDAWDIENINPLLDAHYECDQHAHGSRACSKWFRWLTAFYPKLLLCSLLEQYANIAFQPRFFLVQCCGRPLSGN